MDGRVVLKEKITVHMKNFLGQPGGCYVIEREYGHGRNTGKKCRTTRGRALRISG